MTGADGEPHCSYQSRLDPPLPPPPPPPLSFLRARGRPPESSVGEQEGEWTGPAFVVPAGELDQARTEASRTRGPSA